MTIHYSIAAELGWQRQQQIAQLRSLPHPHVVPPPLVGTGLPAPRHHCPQQPVPDAASRAGHRLSREP